MRILTLIRTWASALRGDVVVLWLAARHPRAPWHVKALALAVVAYALSPIDLIPDFIPVLGWLDDFILLPGLIWLALRLTPPDVLAAARADAQRWLHRVHSRVRGFVAAVAVVLIWLVLCSVAISHWWPRASA